MKPKIMINFHSVRREESNTTRASAEPFLEAIKVRCLRLSLLSEMERLLRPMTLAPVEMGNFGVEVSSSSSRFPLSGTKNPI